MFLHGNMGGFLCVNDGGVKEGEGNIGGMDQHIQLGTAQEDALRTPCL